MGRSGDWYKLDIPEFNWNVGADAMRQDAHTWTAERCLVPGTNYHKEVAS
jgi:hypothetical protein